MKRVVGFVFAAFLSALPIYPASGQELLKAIEPGTGYSRMKQWATQHKLVFENFTKDSLVILGSFSDTGHSEYRIRLLVRFCAGDDYSGRAFQSTLQEIVDLESKDNVRDIFSKERQYLDTLAGKSSDEGTFEGDYKVRRERMDALKGIAVSRVVNQEKWEVGLFVQHNALVLQTQRNKDELCK